MSDKSVICIADDGSYVEVYPVSKEAVFTEVLKCAYECLDGTYVLVSHANAKVAALQWRYTSRKALDHWLNRCIIIGEDPRNGF